MNLFVYRLIRIGAKLLLEVLSDREPCIIVHYEDDGQLMLTVLKGNRASHCAPFLEVNSGPSLVLGNIINDKALVTVKSIAGQQAKIEAE